MTIANKRSLLLIIPVLFFIFSCNNDATQNSTAVDSTVSAADTSRLAGSNAADDISAAVISNALVFLVDDSMQTGKAYFASLSIGKSIPLDYLKNEVRKSANTNSDHFYTDTTLKVTSEMRARLWELSTDSNKNFQISPVTDGVEIQPITEGEGNQAYWQWKVVPLKPGTHALQLEVEIVVDAKTKRYLPSRTIPVTIIATPESIVTKISDFAGKNWQWMITAIFLPIFIAWLTTRIRQRQQSTSSPAKPTRVRKKRK
jgi:hypothetical protein